MCSSATTLTDGSLVQLDEHTRVGLHSVDRIQLIEGRVFISSNGSGPVIAEAGGKRLHVSPGSADHRAHPELFRDDVVAGAVALCHGSGGLPGPCAGLAPAQVIARVRADATGALTLAGGFLGDPLRPQSGRPNSTASVTPLQSLSAASPSAWVPIPAAA